MVEAVEIGSLIDCDPQIRAGRPRIGGTGVTVMRVGESASRALKSFPNSPSW
jgi:uncharacterized protein (DUF433 family)